MLYFMREQVINENLQVNHLPSTYQRADVLTKPPSTKNLHKLKLELNVEEIHKQSKATRES